jgi:hypothetical protein
MRAEDDAIRGADVILSPTRALLEMVVRRLRLERIGPARAVVPYPFARRGFRVEEAARRHMWTR